MFENTQFLAMWTPGLPELIVIGVIALLIFGKNLPKIARGLGQSLTEFKKGVHEAKETKDDIVNDIDDIKDDVAKEVKDAAGFNDSDQQ